MTRSSGVTVGYQNAVWKVVPSLMTHHTTSFYGSQCASRFTACKGQN